MKKFTAILLSIIMLFTVLPLTVFAEPEAEYKTGDIIGFGSYPQTEVIDETLKNKLTAEAGDTDNSNWKSYNYYIKGSQSDFMKYSDIELDGEIYRGVYFTLYRPADPQSSGEKRSSFQDNNGYDVSTIYWFKYEPLLWQILSYDATSDTAVVLSKSVIDSQEYCDITNDRTIATGDIIYPNNYEHSNIRKWLNETFYSTAFTKSEKTAIVATLLDNSAYGEDDSTKYDSNSTTDNVWLLSYSEAQNADYGFTTNELSTETRKAKTTDYAKSQGVNSFNFSLWRLRSAGSSRYSACNVGSDGYVYFGSDVYITGYGVRPALMLHLKSGISPSCIHSFSYEVVSPTCDNSGYTLYTCTKCNATTKDEYTNPTGHSFTGNARVNANGEYTIHCKACNKYLVPSTGDCYLFGTYPQTEVTDETLKGKLTENAGSTDNWISYNYYIDGVQSDYMKYTDIELDGEKYRGVYFTSCRPENTTGKSTNQDANGYNVSVIYWFKYEPIIWQILSYDSATDNAIVLSKLVIDSQEYYNDTKERIIDGKTVYPNNYEYSNIRVWLNSTFYNVAFSKAEKSAIIETLLDNSACDSWVEKYNSNSTTDNVWLLSYAEAKNEEYGFTANDESTETRQAKTTDYAKVQGVQCYSNDASWGLRTAATLYLSSCTIDCEEFGKINSVDEAYTVDKTKTGIRPALTLQIPYEISVSYKLEGGDWVEDYTAPDGYSPDETPPALPTADKIVRDGYTFAGWTLTTDTDTAKEYTATWTANTYDISYELNGGTNATANPATYTYGVGVSELSDPTKDGYTFAGWTLDGNVVTNISTTQFGNITLTAQWEEIPVEPDDSDDDSSGGVRMFYWLKWLLEFLNKLMTKMFNILGWAC